MISSKSRYGHSVIVVWIPKGRSCPSPSTFGRNKERCCNGHIHQCQRMIKIHPLLQKLIVSLRMATVTEEWKLDKQHTSHHDILDSFRLACYNYEVPRNNSIIVPCCRQDAYGARDRLGLILN
jgi:hypothetical protein